MDQWLKSRTYCTTALLLTTVATVVPVSSLQSSEWSQQTSCLQLISVGQGLTKGSNTHLAGTTLLVRAQTCLLQRPKLLPHTRERWHQGVWGGMGGWGWSQILISDRSYLYGVNNQIPKSHQDGLMDPSTGAGGLMSRTTQQQTLLFGLARSVPVRGVASTKQNRLLSCCARNDF